jgi:hypothetical protein
MTSRVDIAAALGSWDGRDVQPFREVASLLPVTASSVSLLMDLVRRDDEACQVGGTWVIKDWLEQGHVFDRRLAGRIVALLERPLCWGATLHLLIMLPMLDLTAARWRDLRSLFEVQLESPNTFVRAWAYNGLGLLAGREPGLRAEIDALFDLAMGSEPASVRARIRNVRKTW